MSERKPPRFPYVAALLCAACLGAAVWTWMRYSYAWDVTPADLWNDPGFIGTYVSMTGRVERKTDRVPVILAAEPSVYDDHVFVVSVFGADQPLPADGQMVTVTGRIDWPNMVWATIDTTASRLHGASVAGLVVGAMGVFVFTVALRHWLRERRAGA